MDKNDISHQIDINTPEGKELLKSIRSNLKVNVEVSSDYEVFLKLSISKDNAYQALGDFLKQSILKRLNFLDSQLVKDIHVSGPNFIKTPDSNCGSLTPREIEIMEKMSGGLSVKEISQAIGMPINTVKTHLKNIYRKLGVKKAHTAVQEFLKIKGVIKQTLEDIQIPFTNTGLLNYLN